MLLFVLMFHAYAHLWVWSFEPGIPFGAYLLYLLGRVSVMLIALYIARGVRQP